MSVSYRILTSLLAGAVLAGLGACSTRVAAPVDDRTSTPVTAPAEARAGYYIVKPGDTLHRIAQDHGVTFRDLATWNQLVDPNRLEVGREIRVVPPDGATVTPIETGGPVEVSPIATDRPAPIPAPPEVKSGPLGGVQPYSDEAWAAAQAEAGVSPAPAAPTAPEPRPATPVAPVPTGIKRVDGIDWSWPTGGQVVGRFSETSARKGLDIGGNTGDPVLAAAGGKVVYSGTGLRGYGKLVIIKHDSNYLSAYAHNDQLMVKEGESVNKGQQIATLGSSDSDRPKLHFEIRRQGKPVDPSNYLPAR
ncbi:MAG: peptidoglycan DD-metalloendopeptidase family protein [Rhodocyclaceae bacterium]|nr:peptidoglycan DD-metalloendopeptidase family protein [Rhodocyclaceae bacterium]